ncbi:hypothetical protein ZOSMA_282G00140 [Zostera marina]|uniref:ATPase inhibitor n=1 Tax=Zostera marina TaxID=29655 RepID=A0A0K9PD50_ZOSMR|nr:hypothetical protein ZOSMA_282G00140 [Zostera marina]
MSTRSIMARMTGMYPRMERSSFGSGTGFRYFSDGKGKIFSEEEKAAENVYIKKMERQKLDKAKVKSEKEKSAAESEKAKSSDEKK